MVHMRRKGQDRFAFNLAPTLKEQFEVIAAPFTSAGQTVA